MSKKITQSQRAEETGVSRRTVNTWQKKGANLQDELKLAKFLATQQRNPKSVSDWVQKIFEKHEKQSLESDGEKLDDGETSEKSLEEIRDYYGKCLSKATSKNDRDSIKYWNELLLKTDESLRRSQAHAAKLGIDKGDMLSKDEVCRIHRAACYAGNACIEGILEQVAEKVSAMESPEQVYFFLKPIMVGGRLFAGMSKVAKTPGDVSVPQWLIDQMQNSADDYLKGAKL